jgi:nucleolar protein 53
LDTDGDVDIPKKFLKNSKPLRVDEIIAQRSVVPAVSVRKRPGSKIRDGTIETKRHRVAYVSHKELTRLRHIADGHLGCGVELSEPAFDLWDQQADVAAKIEDPRLSFLPKPSRNKAPKTLQRKPISLAANGKPIPAVMKPEGGYSYNPIYSDYEERLRVEGEKEVAAELRRLATAEKERLKLEEVARSAAEAEVAETRANLSEWEEDSVWEGFASGTEDVKLSAKRPERKTQAQRNRVKRRKEEERRAKMAAGTKKKDEQVAQIKKLRKEMKAKQNTLALAAVLDESSGEGDDLKLRRRQLGKIALPERHLELVLPDELQESLRLLKPEGNLLRDRYRSFLVRGKLESRRPISFAKKARRKATEKWAHKDFVLH